MQGFGSLSKFVHLSAFGRPHVLALSDGLFPGSSGIAWDDLQGSMELVFAAVCFLCAIGLTGYFTYHHHQTRLSSPKGLRKKSLWTTDQINACLIAFGLGMMFLLIHYSTR